MDVHGRAPSPVRELTPSAGHPGACFLLPATSQLFCTQRNSRDSWSAAYNLFYKARDPQDQLLSILHWKFTLNFGLEPCASDSRHSCFVGDVDWFHRGVRGSRRLALSWPVCVCVVRSLRVCGRVCEWTGSYTRRHHL